MKTQCPHCNQRYEVDDYFANKIVQCPQCQKTFPVLPLLVPIPAQEENPPKETKKTGSFSLGLKIFCFIFGLLLFFSGGFAFYNWWVTYSLKESLTLLQSIYLVWPALAAIPFLLLPFVKNRR